MSLKQRVIDYFMAEAGKVSVKQPPELGGFGINLLEDKEYPRELHQSFEQALRYVVEAGEGFNISASFKGPWSCGSSAGTSDFDIHLPKNILYKFMWEDLEDDSNKK